MTDMWEQLKQNQNTALENAKKTASKHSSDNKDSRFWELSRDKGGNGSAVIRFLPPVAGENEFMVHSIVHFFPANEGGGKGNAYYVEHCPSMWSDGDYDCPVCDANKETWDDNNEIAKKIVRRRSRQHNFITNILVVNDPANPENNGKVFLYKFGKKIKAKIDGCLTPKYAGETPFNPTDFFQGADFNLKSKKEDGQINYDDSNFASQAPACGGNEQMMKQAWESAYPLQPEIAPELEKSYEELEKTFNKVMGSGKARNLDNSTQKTSTQKAPESAGKQQESQSQQQIPQQQQASVGDQAKQDVPWKEEDGGQDTVQEQASQTQPAPENSGVDDDLDFFDSLMGGKE